MALAEEIHNFTETLLAEQIQILGLAEQLDHDTLLDLCCLVLNRLPARYIRHDVDALSDISDTERNQLIANIREQITASQRFLNQDRRSEPRT